MGHEVYAISSGRTASVTGLILETFDRARLNLVYICMSSSQRCQCPLDGQYISHGDDMIKHVHKAWK